MWVEESIQATGDVGSSPVAYRLAYGASVNLLAFLFMIWASVSKPWGTTPWTTRRATARGRAGAPV